MKRILAFLVVALIGWIAIDNAIDALRRSSTILDTNTTVDAPDGGKLFVSIKREEIEDWNHSYTHFRYVHTLSYQASATDRLEQIGQMHGSKEVAYCVKRWGKLLVISHPNFVCKDQAMQGYMGDSSWSVSETYPAIFVRRPDGNWRNWLLTVPRKSSMDNSVENGKLQSNEKNGQPERPQNTVFSYSYLPDEVVKKIWRSIDESEPDTKREIKSSSFTGQFEEMNFIKIDDEKHQLVLSNGGKSQGYERWFYFNVEADGNVVLAQAKLQGIACNSQARARPCSATSLVEYYPREKQMKYVGETSLHHGCMDDLPNAQTFIDTLAEKLTDPTSINAEGLHPLDICLNRNVEKTKKLIKYILTRNDAARSVHPRNGTLLHVICKVSGLDDLKQALTQAIDPNERDFEGKIAIQYCLARRNEKNEASQMVEELVAMGIPKKQYDEYQTILWQQACEGRDPTLAIMLKRRKIALPSELQFKQKLIRRCLDDAGSDAISEVLIPELAATGFDFNIPCCRYLDDKNFRRESILHIAARESRMPLMTGLLIDAGADVLAKDKDGLLPFDVCAQTRCDANKMFAIVRAERDQNDRGARVCG